MRAPSRLDVPSYAELRERTDGPSGSSWGVFGPDDQLGSLNFLTAEHARYAATLVREGRAISLDYPVNAFRPVVGGTRKNTDHRFFMNNPNHRDDWLDSFYLQSTSQLDGLRHIRDPQFGFYGGVPDNLIEPGTPDLGIQLVAERGIVGRGVLLDLARYWERRGEPVDLRSSRKITPEDLDGCAAAQGTELLPGDVLLIRIGWAADYLTLSDAERAIVGGSITSPGLIQSFEMLSWLWDRQFSVVAADNPALEGFPIDTSPGIAGPDEAPPDKGISHNGMLHRPLIARLGIFIGELWNLEELADACDDRQRHEFMLTAKPLAVVGGVGSPPNALALL